MANPLHTPKKINELPLVMVKNFVTLATGGLGVAVALSWNEAIKGLVQRFVDPYFGPHGTVVSLIIYAAIVTTLAVVVTMQLTHLEERLMELDGKFNQKKVTSKEKAKNNETSTSTD